MFYTWKLSRFKYFLFFQWMAIRILHSFLHHDWTRMSKSFMRYLKCTSKLTRVIVTRVDCNIWCDYIYICGNIIRRIALAILLIYICISKFMQRYSMPTLLIVSIWYSLLRISWKLIKLLWDLGEYNASFTLKGVPLGIVKMDSPKPNIIFAWPYIVLTLLPESFIWREEKYFVSLEIVCVEALSVRHISSSSISYFEMILG